MKKMKKITPTLLKFKPIKFPPKAKDNLTGMLKEFRERQANYDGIDYFSDNFNVLDLFNDTNAKATETHELQTKFSDSVASNPHEGEESSPLQLNETKINKSRPLSSSATKPQISTSLAKLSRASNAESPTIFKTPINRKTTFTPSLTVEHPGNSIRRVTRRSSLLALSSPSVDNISNQTKNISESMEITPNVESLPRKISNRRTIFTTSAMDVTDAGPSSKRKRNSIVPTRYEDFEVNGKRIESPTNNLNSQSEKSHRRRTTFAFNQTTSNKFEESTSNRRQTVFAPKEASSPLVAFDKDDSVSNPRKRLFKPTNTTPKLTDVTDETKKTTSLRRRTLLPKKQATPSVVSTLDTVDESKTSTTNRRRTLFTESSTTQSSLGVSELTEVGETKDKTSNRRRTMTPSHSSSSITSSSNKLNGTVKAVNRRRTCFTTTDDAKNPLIPSSQGKFYSVCYISIFILHFKM